MAKLLLFLALALGGALYASGVYAQGTESIFLRGSDTSPSPGENFTVTAEGIGFDKNTATFRWAINDVPQPQSSGRGKNSITIKAGEVGSEILVEVEASRPVGDASGGARVFTVSGLALTWSAETYVPRWYKGKALPSKMSLIRLAAVPHIVLDGSFIPPERLIFNWEVNGQRDFLSGAGEDLLTLGISRTPNFIHGITVSVQDELGRIRKSQAIAIKAVTPRVVVYQYSLLGGTLFHSAIRSAAVGWEGAFDFQAEPFFFLAKDKKDLQYEWFVSGRETRTAPESPYLITIDTAAEKEEAVPVAVKIRQKLGYRTSGSKIFTLYRR